MESRTENSRVVVPLVPRIDSNNFEAIAGEIKAIMDAQPGCGVTLDAKDLEYISSAGLRTMLNLRKAREDFEIVNVSRDVYDIFESTGLTSAMRVVRALREISTEGLEKVGQGGTAAVYRLDDDRIVKVFKPIIARDMIDMERELAQKLFLAGIPTAVPYEEVRCGDSIGVIYELLKAKSLEDMIIRDPSIEVECIHRIADLRKEISDIEVSGLSPVIGMMMYGVDIARKAGVIDEDEKGRYIAYMQSFPDRKTFIHGDFHPGNVMDVDGELMLIDLSAAAEGHVIFDLAGIATYYVAMGQILGEQGFTYFAGITPERGRRLWAEFRDWYFKGMSPEDVELAEKQVLVLAYIRVVCGAAVVPDMISPDKLGDIKAYIDANYDVVMSDLRF